MTLAAATLLIALQFGALAGVRPEPVERMAELIGRHRQAGEPVGEYQAMVRNLVFYAGYRQVALYDDAGAVAFLESPGRVLLVVGRADADRLKTLTHTPMTVLESVTTLDPDSVRVGTLFDPRPERDLQTILLVSNQPAP